MEHYEMFGEMQIFERLPGTQFVLWTDIFLPSFFSIQNFDACDDRKMYEKSVYAESSSPFSNRSMDNLNIADGEKCSEFRIMFSRVSGLLVALPFEGATSLTSIARHPQRVP